MSQLILIRGLPGSGKSTMARFKYPNHIHLESDDYFINSDGDYCFDGSLIKEAHAWCFNTAKILTRQGHNIVVSNTFTQKWEIQKYLELRVTKRVVVATGSYGSIHNVPEDVIKKMAERWEEF